MPNAGGHLVAHAPVLRCKGKRFGECLSAAARILTAEMADTQDHHGIAAEQFRKLDFTKAVTVDMAAAPAAAGAAGGCPGGEGCQGGRTAFLFDTVK